MSDSGESCNRLLSLSGRHFCFALGPRESEVFKKGICSLKHYDSPLSPIGFQSKTPGELISLVHVRREKVPDVGHKSITL